jgi:hypothetical protein
VKALLRSASGAAAMPASLSRMDFAKSSMPSPSS